MPKRLKIDQLWGIERHADSDLEGLVVAPIVMLWDNPHTRHFVIAVAEHATPVLIEQRYDHPDEGRAYFRVAPIKAEWVGWGRRIFRGWIERRAPSGWVSAPFLKLAGDPIHAPIDWAEVDS